MNKQFLYLAVVTLWVGLYGCKDKSKEEAVE